MPDINKISHNWLNCAASMSDPNNAPAIQASAPKRYNLLIAP